MKYKASKYFSRIMLVHVFKSFVCLLPELSLGLVKSSVLLVEQHCALASSSADDGELLRNPNFEFSSSGCLAIACNLLYRCLETLSEDKILTILGSSHLVYALLQAAMKHTEVRLQIFFIYILNNNQGTRVTHIWMAFKYLTYF